ncbi:MAG: DUF5988 family protein [Labedaea sp.]
MEKVKVLLVGGPAHVPNKDRVQWVTELSEKVKLCFGGGYEHFTYQGDQSTADGEDLPVFQWVMRTTMAE